jgi:polyisoprenyl-teichoic acid--peptidoglycan teichoic acid transferase
VTQLASPSSRHGRGDSDARHANPAHYPPSPSSPVAPASSRDDAPRGRHATAQGQNFERIIGWTLLGSLIPGSGLIASGRRAAGTLVLTVTVLLTLAGALAVMVVDPIQFAKSLLSDPNKILIVAGLAILLVLGWVGVVVSTHAATRRFGDLTGGQRALATLLVASLIALVAVPTAFGAKNAYLADDAIRTMFRGDTTPLNKDAKAPDASKPDPWANVPRVNVLLMGGDSGLDRVGIRPDTMIVASIDTKTGNTVLISLPRNLQHVPFPPGSKGAEQFPNGFYCTDPSGVNTECLLNALWTWGDGHPAYYPGDKHPGLTATVEAIEQLTDLNIDQYVMLNLRGFEDFVDAIGGVTVNARSRVPVGGHGSPGDQGGYTPPSEWISPGVQHMNGYHALWYARARQYSSDFDRMQRQRCVMGAVINQANPTSLALGFSQIMTTLKKNFLTSIPLKDVDAWVTLALKVKKAKITSLAFTDTVINTTHPDVAKMRELVKRAINPSSSTPTATVKPSPSASPSGSTNKKKVVPVAPAETGQATDLNAVC